MCVELLVVGSHLLAGEVEDAGAVVEALIDPDLAASGVVAEFSGASAAAVCNLDRPLRLLHRLEDLLIAELFFFGSEAVGWSVLLSALGPLSWGLVGGAVLAKNHQFRREISDFCGVVHERLSFLPLVETGLASVHDRTLPNLSKITNSGQVVSKSLSV